MKISVISPAEPARSWMSFLYPVVTLLCSIMDNSRRICIPITMLILIRINHHKLFRGKGVLILIITFSFATIYNFIRINRIGRSTNINLSLCSSCIGCWTWRTVPIAPISEKEMPGIWEVFFDPIVTFTNSSKREISYNILSTVVTFIDLPISKGLAGDDDISGLQSSSFLSVVHEPSRLSFSHASLSSSLLSSTFGEFPPVFLALLTRVQRSGQFSTLR